MTALETLHRKPALRPGWAIWMIAAHLMVLLLWWRLGWAWGLPALLLAHACFVLPVFLPRARLYAPVVDRLAGDAPQVWLTIDDGPSDDTPALLDLLDRHAARATFFLVGERARARPELVREILRRGHGIGNHSDSHPQAAFWRLGPRRLEREIAANQRTLTELSGQAPRWFRSVVGHTNPFIGPVLARHGLTRIAWSARGFDGVDCAPAPTVARIVRDLRPGAIVLLHEGAAHGHTLEIVAGVLEALDTRGLKTVLP